MRIGSHGREAPPTSIQTPPTPDTPGTDPAPGDDDTPSPFARLLHGVGREMQRGEALVKTALAGRDLGAGQLLALQAGVYRYSESVDLASKIVDRGANSVKTVIQGQ
jgi:hypothetical protein